jgi:hypothetical protein
MNVCSVEISLFNTRFFNFKYVPRNFITRAQKNDNFILYYLLHQHMHMHPPHIHQELKEAKLSSDVIARVCNFLTFLVHCIFL